MIEGSLKPLILKDLRRGERRGAWCGRGGWVGAGWGRETLPLHPTPFTLHPKPYTEGGVGGGGWGSSVLSDLLLDVLFLRRLLF